MTGDLSKTLDRLSKGLKDLSPLSGSMQAALDRGNREGLGTDAQGQPLAPLKDSTLKKRKGSGPPLAPEGASSSIVTGAVFSTSSSSDGQLSVEVSWPSLPWLQYAVSGTSRMPARDVVGIRPKTVEDVMQELRQYYEKLI